MRLLGCDSEKWDIIWLLHKRLSCTKDSLGKFYRSLNSIIRVEGRSDDMVMLRLLESHSLPILTYAIEIIHVHNRDDNRQLRVAYNAIYRKLFGYSYRESVTDCE